MDCIFCRIVNGEIPSYKVFENNNLIAILDISQATKGHTLIIPKTHAKNLYELDDLSAAEIFKVVPSIAKGIKRAFNPIGLNVVINTEKPLQSVNHFHIHLVPRYDNDGFDINFINHQADMSQDKYNQIKQAIKDNL
ncbi:MAG: HIT family protein [Candidatus Izemoplasmatales bacterium]|jgi:histidine triad (HIT) family protein|nr:HIT family protein [Candidatus Izemoplasmatales bacterium]